MKLPKRSTNHLQPRNQDERHQFCRSTAANPRDSDHYRRVSIVEMQPEWEPVRRMPRLSLSEKLLELELALSSSSISDSAGAEDCTSFGGINVGFVAEEPYLV